jgi:hypothetical protein
MDTNLDVDSSEKTLTLKKGSRLADDISKQNLFLSKLFESARKLDASIVEPFIDEDDQFEEGTKYHFLASLKRMYTWGGMKDEVETVNERDVSCVSEHWCKFRDGVSTKGMRVRGFSYYSKPKKERMLLDLEPRFLFSFGLVQRFEQDLLTDIMLCGSIKPLPQK